MAVKGTACGGVWWMKLAEVRVLWQVWYRRCHKNVRQGGDRSESLLGFCFHGYKK